MMWTDLGQTKVWQAGTARDLASSRNMLRTDDPPEAVQEGQADVRISSKTDQQTEEATKEITPETVEADMTTVAPTITEELEAASEEIPELLDTSSEVKSGSPEAVATSEDPQAESVSKDTEEVISESTNQNHLNRCHAKMFMGLSEIYHEVDHLKEKWFYYRFGPIHQCYGSVSF